MVSLTDNIYNHLENILYENEDDVYSAIYEYFNESYPELVPLLDYGTISVNVVRHNEGINLIGYEADISLDEIMEDEFKLKYPEEGI